MLIIFFLSSSLTRMRSRYEMIKKDAHHIWVRKFVNMSIAPE